MTKIQLRRGDAEDWTDANPTLSAGEPGLELDTGKFKFGDGTTAWNDLAYIGSGGFDFVQAEDPGAVGAGKLWLQLSTLGADTWSGENAYESGAIVQPTVANGHTYTAEDPGLTSGDTEPDWATNGDPTSDGDGIWDDNGLSFAGGETWIRNVDDSGWNALNLIIDGDGIVRGRIWWDDDAGRLVVSALDGDGETAASLGLAPGKISLTARTTGRIDFDLSGGDGPAGHFRITNSPTGALGTAVQLDSGQIGAAGQFIFIYGDQDPTSPSVDFGGPDPYDFGVGTLYARAVDASTGELWFQTGSGPAAWVNLTP